MGVINNNIMEAYFRLPIEIVKGDGCYLFDSNSKKYIDFATGIAVLSLGHNNKKIVDALINQAKKLWHCSNLFTIPDQVKLAKKLTDATFAEQVFFCSTGLEAVETAIKIIRKHSYEQAVDKNNYPTGIITFENGFHGRSIACLSAGGNESSRRGFGPLLPDFYQIPICKTKFNEVIASQKIAGVIIEPVQSEGGVHEISVEFMQYIRKITKENNIILCLDEVQTGFGRCGSMFKYQQLDIKPDIMTIAKAMGNGFPVAACLTTNKIGSSITPGSHGSTFGGNPLAMAVANIVFDEIYSDDLFENVNKLSMYFYDKITILQTKYPEIIKDIRIYGLLIGIEIKLSAKKFITESIDHGLIITKAGNDDVLRILPPLNISTDIIDEAVNIIEIVIKKISSI